MRRNSGFGIAGLVVAVAVVAIVGVVGWRIWDTNKGEGESPDSSSSNQANTETYLSIKELGVKIKLDDAIKDAVYYYDSSARVSTKTLIEKSAGTCDPKSSAPFGILTGAEGAAGTRVFESGSTSITLDMSTGTCTDDPEAQAAVQAQLQHFKEALKTMELDR